MFIIFQCNNDGTRIRAIPRRDSSSGLKPFLGMTIVGVVAVPLHPLERFVQALVLVLGEAVGHAGDVVGDGMFKALLVGRAR